MANTPNLKKLYQDEVAARPGRTPRCWTPW